MTTAVKHQNFPIELLYDELEIRNLFQTALLLEEIHDSQSFRQLSMDIAFFFSGPATSLAVEVKFNPQHYKKESIARIKRHLFQILENALDNIATPVQELQVMTNSEKEQLLTEINRTETSFPVDITIHQLFTRQVELCGPGFALLVG